MLGDSVYQKGYIQGYWDGVKAAASGEIADCQKAEIAKLPVKAMSVSHRARNCLIYSGCQNIGDVIALRSDEIRRMRNLGPKTAAEIARWMIGNGIVCSAWSEYI